MRLLEKIILSVPYLLFRMILYAWLGVVWFWSWPPVLSGSLLVVALLGFLMIAWQKQAWGAKIRRECSSAENLVWMDHPHAARGIQIRNLVLMLAGSAVCGWLLTGRLGLNGLQWWLMLTGIMLLSRDAMLFGAATTYIVTDQGIGVRWVPGQSDYRMFFKFREIRRVTRTKVPERIPQRWEVLAAQRHPKEGVLLTAMRSGGFSNQIGGEVLLAPTDIDKFLEALAGHVAVMQEAVATTSHGTIPGR